MVHIRKVEIFGFKSFGFKNTVVDFRPGLISISGPNGSGKSNILDAMIFAMGENRPKIMRVDKLKSLLHDEDARRAQKMARVSVHFDNSDRKIPADYDSVEITREMDDKGENIYYLNKKKTNRSHILNLLDVAKAGLHQLNAVQQGTVTRIAEFTPEEKREAIENLIGISSFDEKKAESKKQLDDADMRLEVALARMGEMKKRIDDLEEERNLKMRHDLLEREIGRLEAISSFNHLKTVMAQKQTKEQKLDELSSKTINLERERTVIRDEIKSTEAKKDGLMEAADTYQQEKASIDAELSKTMQEFEQARTEVTVAKKQADQIRERLHHIPGEIQTIHDTMHAAKSHAAQIRQTLEESSSKKDRINADVKTVLTELDAVAARQSEILEKKSKFDAKIKKLGSLLNESKLKLSQLQSNLSETDAKIAANSAKQNDYNTESKRLLDLKSKLDSVVYNHKAAVAELESRLSGLDIKRAKTEKYIEDLGLMLEKSSKAGNKYDAKIRLVKDMMHEDYSAAKLKENADELGILGLAYELISWNKEDERAVLAASSDWIKATVVKDFATLVSLAEYVRHKGLPKLRIIPLDAIPKIKPDLPNQSGVIAALSDRVSCDSRHSALKTFLFGGVILAESRKAAYGLSRQGHRAVTPDGELFEPKSAAAVIDVNSRISKLTKIISMSTSVDGLLASVSLLRKHVQRKRNSLKRIDASIRDCRDRLHISQTGLATSSQTRDDLALQIDTKSKTLDGLAARITDLEKRRSYLTAEIAKQESYVSSLTDRVSLTQENYSDGELHRIAGELTRLNAKKSALENERTGILDDYHVKSSKMAQLEAQETKETTIIKNLQEEKDRLELDMRSLEETIAISSKSIESGNADLVKLRETEQELISTSGDSVGELKKYDDRLRDLNDQDKSLTKNINQTERSTDSLSRDLRDLREKQTNLQRMLDGFDFDVNTADDFDVEPVLQALSAEQRGLTALNAKAPATYLEASYGYRSMSSRKNSLEEERNRIVRFIEEIEKDKRQTFLDAFDRVDKEVRHMFSKMIGGNAYLELQNEDDIFNSGVSYMIQLPDKKKRESTSISGGEKTLAGIVFVLALQKLEPSPFYLFDEVDAHLDSQNSERLSKILEERSKESQFIMVSLKESVVEKAKLIYGVFSKNGVSDVVTYKDKRLPSVITSS